MSKWPVADILATYQGSDGAATARLYDDLKTLGPDGEIAVNLFRACKASERAKVYRGGRRGFRSTAYQKKDWSLQQLAQLLDQRKLYTFGWGIDAHLRANDDPHHHVLYVDLPTGQVSFHCGARHDGPDYHGVWDGRRGTAADRICRHVARMFSPVSA